MGIFREFVSWSQKRMRENRTISEIERDVERRELQTQEVIAEERFGSSGEIAKLTVAVEKENLRKSLPKRPPTTQEIVARIGELNREQEEVLRGITDRREITRINRVFEAKRRAAELGEF